MNKHFSLHRARKFISRIAFRILFLLFYIRIPAAFQACFIRTRLLLSTCVHKGLLCNRDRESISLHALLGTYGVELRELLYQREELTALITKAIQQDYYVILDTNDLENVHKPDANEVRAQSQYHFILIIGVDTQGRQMIVYDSKFRNTLNYGTFSAGL